GSALRRVPRCGAYCVRCGGSCPTRQCALAHQDTCRPAEGLGQRMRQALGRGPNARGVPDHGAVFAASSRHCAFPYIRFRCCKDPEQCPSHIRGRRRAQERIDAFNSCCRYVHQEARLRYDHPPTGKEALVGTSERAPSQPL
ncbi:TPA: hypothetical protein N0F65_000436, partial [Lagenidium giganteum]